MTQQAHREEERRGSRGYVRVSWDSLGIKNSICCDKIEREGRPGAPAQQVTSPTLITDTRRIDFKTPGGETFGICVLFSTSSIQSGSNSLLFVQLSILQKMTKHYFTDFMKSSKNAFQALSLFISWFRVHMQMHVISSH